MPCAQETPWRSRQSRSAIDAALCPPPPRPHRKSTVLLWLAGGSSALRPAFFAFTLRWLRRGVVPRTREACGPSPRRTPLDDAPTGSTATMGARRGHLPHGAAAEGGALEGGFQPTCNRRRRTQRGGLLFPLNGSFLKRITVIVSQPRNLPAAKPATRLEFLPKERIPER